MGSSKVSVTKSKANTKRKKTTSKEEREKKLRLHHEIKGFCLLIAGIYFFYATLDPSSGWLGSVVSNLMKVSVGQFGCYLLVLALFFHGVMLLIKHPSFTTYSGAVYLYISVANLCVVIALFDKTLMSRSLATSDFYMQLLSGKTHGGIIGGVAARVCTLILGRSGSVLLVLLVGICSFIMIFRKSILELFTASETDAPAKTKPKREVKQISAPVKESKKKPLIISPEPAPKPVKPIAITDTEVKAAPPVSPPPKPKPPKVSPGEYIKPSIELLEKATDTVSASKRQQEVLSNVTLLEKTLSDFSISANVAEVSIGPTVTRYELQLSPGIRVNKVVNLADDLAMSLAAQRVRIEAPIPGKSAIGIEVPNKENSIVRLSTIIASPQFTESNSPLSIALGKDLTGGNLVLDVTQMPHLLIAGATGSGKSVCINSIIMSILFHASPEEVRLILIDPKMVELSVYNDVPHLLIPVVTDPKDAAGALGWAVREMTKRYELFSRLKVRNLMTFNEKCEEAGEEKLYHILLIIDELNDLMMVSAQAVEGSITRLSQLARAAGIHLIIATQRPSVNVITGVIKANIPTRISFAVMSQVDSRTILDMGGAEKLLGKGDMLYLPQDKSSPLRAQCAYVGDKEIENVVEFLKEKATAEYDESVMEGIKIKVDPLDFSASSKADNRFEDELLPKAMEIAFEKNIISTSTIQRRLRLGYARAGRIIDEMEEKGFVSAADGSKPRKVLVSKEEFFGGTYESET